MARESFTVAALMLLVVLHCVTATIPKAGVQERRHEVLSQKHHYHASWQANFTSKTIDFFIQARTTGFIGFGFSHNGGMNRADLVVGGVGENGEMYFKDYHGEGNHILEDKQQDWKALHITESNGVTEMHLTRKFETCDTDDIEITEGTIKLMWSLGDTDSIEYHGKDMRGQLAVNLLDPPPKDIDLSSYKTFNITSKINMTAANDTIYWCSIHKREATNKSQIVAFKPKLDGAGALKYTHHFNAWKCVAEDGDDADIFEKWVNHPGDSCFSTGELIEKTMSRCMAMFYAWSLGGRVLVLPEDVGFSWGEAPVEYFFLEVHLDNVVLDTMEVETGVTFYYTEEIRPIEAGILTIEHKTIASLLIPPATKDWEVVGHCNPECLGMGLNPETGINVFNINLHAHISARKVRVRHFRDGKELPWIADDPHYDFNFQENRPLPEEIKILPKDHITMECTFDSTWKRGHPAYRSDGAVIGGYSSYDEMCMVFALYYPRNKVERCSSWTSMDYIYNKFGIQTTSKIPGSEDLVINLPEKWANRTFSDVLNKEVQWTPRLKSELQEQFKYGVQESNCRIVGKGNVRLDSGKFLEEPKASNITYPDIDTPHAKPSSCGESEKSFPLVGVVVLGCMVAITVGIVLSVLRKRVISKVKSVYNPVSLR